LKRGPSSRSARLATKRGGATCPKIDDAAEYAVRASKKVLKRIEES